MNRKGKYSNGAAMPGVFQRCADDCPADGCRVHKWAYDLELPAGRDGKRRRATKSGFLTAKAADTARKELVRLHRAGDLPADGKLTVEVWLTRWLTGKSDQVASDAPLRAGTAVSYAGHVRKYLVPYLGARKLAELRSTHITEMFSAVRKEREAARTAAIERNRRYAAEAEEVNAERRAKGLTRMVAPTRMQVPRTFSRSTATRVRATLSSALADAFVAGEVTRNVAAQARQRKGRRDTRPQVKVCEPEQLGAFLDAIEADRERLYPLIHVATFAGLRRGELCGLKWSAVDLDAGRITVDWQRTTAGYRVVEGRPKTDESESTVDIDVATVAVLRAWRKVQLAERLAWGSAWTDSGLVFTREDGTGWHPEYVGKRFGRLARCHGLPDGTHLHTLRHTAASLQLASGTDIAIVSKRLRHSSLKLTSDTYSHLIGAAGKRAAEAASALVPRRRRTA